MVVVVVVCFFGSWLLLLPAACLFQGLLVVAVEL